MRTLNQIANDEWAEHTSRDIEVLEVVRRETVQDFADRLGALSRRNKTIATQLLAEFWRDC